MCYGQARLTVGNGNQFLVGDINGGATNVISFTETTYLNGGGAFILPQNMGNITGMVFTVLMANFGAVCRLNGTAVPVDSKEAIGECLAEIEKGGFVARIAEVVMKSLH